MKYQFGTYLTNLCSTQACFIFIILCLGGNYFCDLLLNSFMLKGLISCKLPRLRITEHVDIDDTTNLPNITGDGL